MANIQDSKCGTAIMDKDMEKVVGGEGDSTTLFSVYNQNPYFSSVPSDFSNGKTYYYCETATGGWAIRVTGIIGSGWNATLIYDEGTFNPAPNYANAYVFSVYGTGCQENAGTLSLTFTHRYVQQSH